ncbi:hypothetical protein QQ045_011202 [Rhodiola kirilowii]
MVVQAGADSVTSSLAGASLADASLLRRRFSRDLQPGFSLRRLFTPTPIQIAEEAPGMGSPRAADCFDPSSDCQDMLKQSDSQRISSSVTVTSDLGVFLDLVYV